MTNPNYTHITVVLDESGSMGPLAADTRGGFNSMLADQRKVEGKATMTVCKFSNGCHVLSELQDIHSVPDLTKGTYTPGGGTALFDALVRTITDLGAALEAMAEEDRPGKVLFIVVTDGHENMSQPHNTREKVAEMIKHQEQNYKWNFLYMGANLDAFAESGALGIRPSNTINYSATSKGTHDAYHVMSASVGAVRGLDASDMQYDVFNSAHVDDLAAVDHAERFKQFSNQVASKLSSKS